MPEAKLIRQSPRGLELRLAGRRRDTWPGWEANMPLGKAGYWLGTHGDHVYLGRTKGDLPENLEEAFNLAPL